MAFLLTIVDGLSNTNLFLNKSARSYYLASIATYHCFNNLTFRIGGCCIFYPANLMTMIYLFCPILLTFRIPEITAPLLFHKLRLCSVRLGQARSGHISKMFQEDTNGDLHCLVMLVETEQGKSLWSVKAILLELMTTNIFLVAKLSKNPSNYRLVLTS